MKKPMHEIDSYLVRFEQLEKDVFRKEPETIRELRRSALSRFADLGFPTSRLEEWRFTNVAPIAKMRFELARDGLNGFKPDQLRPLALEGAWQVVFVNGRFAPEFSSLGALPEGVEVRSLADVLESSPEKVEPHLGRYARFEDHAFVALNTAFMGDGAFVRVAPGRVIEKPIHLIFVSTAAADASVAHIRNLIVVEENSQAAVVERYVGLGDAVYLTNAVSEVVAGANTVIDHYKLQQESVEAFHIATLQYHQGGSSNVRSHNVALGAGLSRNDVNAVLDGEGGDCLLNGFYLGTDRQHIDNHTRIYHVKPHCTSLEIYKGILNDHARGVFNGRIIVDKEAQKTNAIQTNRNLLLSDDSLVNSNPQLEIYADDVKCTHGSTIGQLDEESMFYLRSRGLSYEAARALLISAFAGEVFDQMKIDAIRAALSDTLSERLGFRPMPRE